MVTSEMTPADIAAVTGGNGSGSMWGGNDGAFWIIILFLFAAMGGWGNGNGFGGGGTSAEVQRGFDQNAVMSGLNGIGANMNANQANLMTQLSAMQMAQQNCCCENRQAVSDLRYTIATESAADRQAFNAGVNSLLANQTQGIQTILDKLCQQELDALKTQNANLQTQLNMANLAASQTAQTARILQDNAAQTVALEQYLNPVPIPAYVVQNPNCCTPNYGCGCGVA